MAYLLDPDGMEWMQVAKAVEEVEDFVAMAAYNEAIGEERSA